MNPETLLLRQVHPSFVQNGRASSQVFRPTPKDEQRLSVYNADMIEPEGAYQHYTGQLGHSSMGVLAVTVQECNTAEIPALMDPEPFPEHAVLDFTGLSKGATEKKAKLLRQWAESRGWLYRASM